MKIFVLVEECPRIMIKGVQNVFRCQTFVVNFRTSPCVIHLPLPGTRAVGASWVQSVPGLDSGLSQYPKAPHDSGACRTSKRDPCISG